MCVEADLATNPKHPAPLPKSVTALFQTKQRRTHSGKLLTIRKHQDWLSSGAVWHAHTTATGTISRSSIC